ncbi:anti-anti-sigma factor [Klenkia taihuensis]|uniref:Anti-anti-sigma factor n=2 Tax=Klenkia taihuensis TaxID=1225127 RepID=A0A1I1P1A0_9ACTN|nr:anti-anti-sigma factor [Klenkia taihuensis]
MRDTLACMTTDVDATAPDHGSVELSADGTQLVFSGEIDKDVVRQFRVTVRPADWPARVDVREVTFMSSAGLELLVHLARKQKRSGGELEVVEPPTSLRLLLNQTGLTRVFRSVPAPVTPA